MSEHELAPRRIVRVLGVDGARQLLELLEADDETQGWTRSGSFTIAEATMRCSTP